jgi:hypothetical protein
MLGRIYNYASLIITLLLLLLLLLFDLRGVSGLTYAYNDYSPRSTGHPASPGAGKAPRG